MLCENCKKASSTFHYRHSDNNKVTEVHLCSECAKELGYLNASGSLKSGGFESVFESPFSYFLSSTKKNQNAGKRLVCTRCGMTERELRAGGLIGCAECYNVFSDVIGEMLKKLQLSSDYKGKIPSHASKQISFERKIEKLEQEMKSAVIAQEYEEAARIRDAIKLLREENLKGEGEK